MREGIRVVCVIHSLQLGGMEKVMSILINNFSVHHAADVHLVLIGRHRLIDFPIDNRITIHKPAFTFNEQIRTISTIKTLWFIRSKIKELKPHSILSFGELWNNLVLISCVGLPYPIYISDRSQPNKNLGVIHNFLKKRLYPLAKGYIAQTSHAENVAEKLNLNANIKVIGNPIQINLPTSISKEKIVLSVGRLIPSKNFDKLIDIFCKLDVPGWKLVIVGGDANNLNLSKDLKNKIESLNKSEAVELVGASKDVMKYYAKSEIFAFASSSEGFPNVVGEALSAGLAVISFDCIAGPRDMIKNRVNGELIELYNYSDFENRLKVLMEDEALRKTYAQEAIKSMRAYSDVQISANFFHFITAQNNE